MAFRGMGETQLHLNTGDVNNPSLCHQNDLDTGLYFDAQAPSVSQTIAGSENMRCRGATLIASINSIFTNNSSTAGPPRCNSREATTVFTA